MPIISFDSTSLLVFSICIYLRIAGKLNNTGGRGDKGATSQKVTTYLENNVLSKDRGNREKQGLLIECAFTNIPITSGEKQLLSGRTLTLILQPNLRRWGSSPEESNTHTHTPNTHTHTPNTHTHTKHTHTSYWCHNPKRINESLYSTEQQNYIKPRIPAEIFA